MHGNYWSQALATMKERVDWTLNQDLAGFPNYADPDTGMWQTSPDGSWTGAFWNGMLWLSVLSSPEGDYREAARRWAAKLEPRLESETVFRGFLFYYGAAMGSILVRDDNVKDLAIAGAYKFASAYNPNAEAIPLGTEAEEASDVGLGEANIDGVPGAALLFWAAQEASDSSLRDLGIAHAKRHIEMCVRPDGSVVQSVSFDPETGKVTKRYTHKGLRDDSTWARAQAWAMVGYALGAQWVSTEPELLSTAIATADWWIDNVPSGRVARWDFDDDDPSAALDTSSTAIAAAALLKLSYIAPTDEQRRVYRDEAEKTVEALIENHLVPIGSEQERTGMLLDGCYNKRIDLATSNELIWGSYYLYECLHDLSGHLHGGAI